MIKILPNIVVQTIARLLIPFIQLFALYVIMHGHYSPGGGFQGGVILAASFILWVIAYDLTKVRQHFSEKLNAVYNTLGVFIFAGIGVVCMIMGGNYLDYGELGIASSKAQSRSLGILGIEIGVAITVMAIMVTIFLNILAYRTDKGAKTDGSRMDSK